MSLSLCLLTADPHGRVASIIEPLRPYADEILIAADSRVDERTLAGYAAISDRLFRIEFCMIERHLAWLWAQCNGDWILRLDGDEVASESFTRRLPDLLATRTTHQFWTPNAWLFPDAEHRLALAPWSTDFVARLVRNDGTLRTRGDQHMHMEPVTPREYLAEPFYHLALLTRSEQERRDKSIRYEVARPRLIATGGGRINEAFNLPELRDALELGLVPEEDRARIARALAPPDLPVDEQPSAASAPFVSLAEMDRLWEGRPVGDGAYRAFLEPLEPTCTMAPGETRQVFIHVANEGDERWPALLEEAPPIRLSYHWLDQDGATRIQEGPRSALLRAITPGERVLVPLNVAAPTQPGSYVLEVDLVHEGVRWFNCARRIPVAVAQPAGLPTSGDRLKETATGRFRRLRAQRIPRTIHRVWLGEAPMPQEFESFARSFVAHHPDWEMRLWTDADLTTLGLGPTERARARTAAELSNLVRYELLHRYGGVYVDADVECLRALTPLLRGIDAFAALEAPGRVGNAVLGAVAGHPVFARAARLARRTVGIGACSPDASGPYFLSLIIEQEPRVTLFPSRLFYPYSWEEPERRHESFPDAYTVHHWTMSWRNGH